MKHVNIGFAAFCEILTVVFVILKLTDAIAWGWVWVLSPLWIYVIGKLLFLIIAWIVVKKGW